MKNRKQGFLGAERRKFPRASARVIYAVVKNEEYLGNEVYTKDISLGGIAFIVKHFIAKDEILSFDITFPQGKSFAVQGQVIRSEEIKVKWSAGKEYKIGVQFISLPVSAQEHIREYLLKFVPSLNAD